MVLGILAVVFLAVLVYGLLTRRIAWRQEACCAPSDPRRDARMRTALHDDAGPRA